MSYNANIVVLSGTTSSQSAVITSTKVRVMSNVAVHYSVGANPAAFPGNCEILPSNTVRYVNMEGLNNKLAFCISGGDTVGKVSIVPCGTVNSRSVYNWAPVQN